jgi:hypothetical protein
MARSYDGDMPQPNLDEICWHAASQRVWPWVTTTTLVTVFLIQLSRGSQVAKGVLGQAFQGIY